MPTLVSSLLSTPFKRILRSTDQKDDAADTCTPAVTVLPSNPDEPRQELPQNIPMLSGPSNPHSWQFVITSIRTNDIAIDLGRIPVRFYVIVEADGMQWRTRHKPILVHERTLEWDDEIVFPLALSSDVRIRVCASFEISPVLGNGETLRIFVIGSGELPELSETAKSIECRPLEGEPISPCSLLHITVERRSYALGTPTPVPNQQSRTYEEDSPNLTLLTDEGHKSLSHYHEDEKPEDLKHSIACFERAVQSCPLTHPCRAVTLFNLATARLISSQVGITSPDFDVSITLYRDALDLRPVGHPDRPTTLLHLARATMSRFLKWGGDAYAEEAKKLIAQVQDICSMDSYEYQLADRILQECEPDEVTSGREAVSHPADSMISVPDLEDTILHTSDQDPQKPVMLDSLSVLLLSRFEHLGNTADIDGSIVATEKAVELAQECHDEWPQRATCLGVLIGRRFRQSHSMQDLERSISVLDKVVQRIPDAHPDRPLALVNLGISVFARFGRLGQMEDVDKSISAQEEAIRLVPSDHPSRSAFLTHLGAAFFKRSERLNNPVDLDRSIALMEEATRCAPKDKVDAVSPMYRLEPPNGVANSSMTIFTRLEALQILLDCRVLGHRRLVHLGHAFQLRFVHHGDPADLDRSISMREEVLRVVPRSDQARPSCLASLGYAFLIRYQRLGNLSDIHNSTSVLEEAVRLTPDGPERSERLIEFGASLTKRFERLGNIIDIDQAISVEEEALQCIDSRHPRSSWLSILGASLLRRFERLGHIADLEKSISMMEEGARLTLVEDPDRPRRLACLAVAFRSRFDRLGDLSDLNKSILMLEEATQLVPDANPIKRSALTALAYAMQVRSERLRNMADQDRSILVAEKAVQLTPVDDPGFPATLSTVGALLLRRFLWKGNVADLDRSTSFLERALHLVPEDHPDRLPILVSAGTLFASHFNALGSLPALQSAISYFSCAARSRGSGRPSVQFQAFKFWVECIIVLHRGSNRHAYEALFEAFECALDLFPQLAWIGLPFKERYTKLLDAANITRSAVSVAVILGHIARAVEWLEQGRCVVWGQVLQLRTPLDELRHAHSDLANQFEWLSNALEYSSTAHDESLSRIGDEKAPGESLEQRARRHRELVTKMENLLEKIQALPGFERFLLPKTFVQLRASAHLGPVVLLNVNQIYGSALIVVADLDEPVHVPLPGINDMQAQNLRTLLNKLLSNDGRIISRDNATRAARPVAKDGQDFSHILSELWIKVVTPVLHALALSTPGKLTRVFWCPTGPLSFLPIHAAGNYDVPGPGNKASDFIISSYVPTLSVLMSSHERATFPNNVRLLVVPQPSSDGQSHLSGARDEIERIKATIGGLSSAHVRIRESNGSVEGVMEGMEQSDWVHFACHGVQDAQDPTESGVCLADQRRLRLSDIIRLSRPRGGLAFLSACQTATGAVELSEEAVHLSAGMLFAGYSGVIGTMWSIKDSVAPRLAQDVYEQLFRDGRAPDSREAARALRDAAESLRQSGEPFMAWVPFVHMGI